MSVSEAVSEVVDSSSLILDSLEIKIFRAFSTLTIEKLGRVTYHRQKYVGNQPFGGSSALCERWSTPLFGDLCSRT
jgi:hypothetical protein